MRITYNGKPLLTEAPTLFALRDSLYPETDQIVAILDGYQAEEDLPLREGASVVLIEKGKLPPEDCFEQMLLARLSPGVYDKVKAARVGIAGLGGLGSRIALDLARSGVGWLHLVDCDIVEPSNLIRQQYRVSHLGLPKTEAIKRQIEEINPYIKISVDYTQITAENAVSLFRGDRIVCEALDRPEAKAMLVNALLSEEGGPAVVASSGMAGMGSGNSIQSRRVLSRLYLCGDGETASEAGNGLMAPRVAICAGHQANTALRLILGETEA